MKTCPDGHALTMRRFNFTIPICEAISDELTARMLVEILERSDSDWLSHFAEVQDAIITGKKL